MITFFKAVYDPSDPTKNGGSITNEQIESGVLESLVPNITPFLAERGGERWLKFFIKTDSLIKNVGICLIKPTDCPTEEVYLTLGTKNDYESDLDKSGARIFGSFVISAIDQPNKSVTADRDVSSFVQRGDLITFYGEYQDRLTTLEVDNVSQNEISFVDFTDISAAKTGGSTIFIPTLQADDYVGVWIHQTIQPHTKSMETPPDNFVVGVWYEQ